jgi:cysteine desulfurase
MEKIYMDYAGTTPVDKEVIDEMLPFFNIYFGNASSIHSFGIDAFNAVEKARERVAKIIGAKNDEIIFTSGGTESDNIAIKGTAFKNKNKKNTKGYKIWALKPNFYRLINMEL